MEHRTKVRFREHARLRIQRNHPRDEIRWRTSFVPQPCPSGTEEPSQEGQAFGRDVVLSRG